MDEFYSKKGLESDLFYVEISANSENVCRGFSPILLCLCEAKWGEAHTSPILVS